MPTFRPYKLIGKKKVEQLRLNFTPYEARVRFEHKTLSLGHYQTREEAEHVERKFRERRGRTTAAS